MIQQALGYFFLIVASTLGFITVYTQIDSSIQQANAAKRNLSPLRREMPIVIYICAVLILMRVITTGFSGEAYWLFVNLQVIILVYSNFLVPSVPAFLTVQAVGGIIFGTSGMMDWFSWIFLFASDFIVFAERWYGPKFKHYRMIYMVPAMIIGIIFWAMIGVRFPELISTRVAVFNGFSFCYAYFALQRFDQDQHVDQQIIAKLTHETQYDGLTQVRNWSTFQEDFNDAFHADGELALIALDIDHFKDINDTYGHLVGNQALMVVSSNLSKYFKENYPAGHVYRTGGEEFAIILPHTDQQVASDIVLTCQKRVQQAQVRYSQGEFNLTASFGLAVDGGKRSGDPTLMFKRADHYLYQSKHNGRDCVTVEGQTLPASQNSAVHS
ncbi:GGDEF domain-containing protein [Lacticaseibacillus zhaodongensis]|uniref:GGDEF domain-containing protein n=1 Tax=Lacticaseibacillus zhaodongensis TaxID=2668065 RepID=UPI0012D2ECD2|nr:GGDEF domain-containing protein [Lacticaseibacillus zhaodongensis]